MARQNETFGWNEQVLLKRRGGGKYLDLLGDWLAENCPFREKRHCQAAAIVKWLKRLKLPYSPFPYDELDEKQPPCGSCVRIWDELCNLDNLSKEQYESYKQKFEQIWQGG